MHFQKRSIMKKASLVISILSILCGLGVTRPAKGTESQSAKKPNVLFVLIDDMGYADLSCFGGQRVKTPVIDQLAKEGMRFTHFYVNSPICSPSRVALTTGQFPNRWRITSYLNTREDDKKRGVADWLSPEAPVLAKYLHDAGYYTAHVGKWHMGGQRDVSDAPLITSYGFDYSITNFEGLGPRILPKFRPNPDGTPFRHPPTELSAKYGIGPITWVDRWWETNHFVDHAIEQIKIAQKQNKPFYINLWPDDVHTPSQPPEGMIGDGSKGARYCGVLRETDHDFARIFDYIRSKPELRDNTLILLCSDNGPEPGAGSAGELRGTKGQLYEGGIRSPLIVWWPSGMSKDAIGTTNDKTVVAAVDFLPSVLKICGVALPQNVKFDGVDMSEALSGKTQPTREKVLMWVRPPDRPGPHHSLPDLAIRDGSWKLLIDRDGSKPQLYDVKTDPDEKQNVAADNPAVLDRLKEQVISWEEAVGH
jgi:uncharacterized sulfatase